MFLTLLIVTFSVAALVSALVAVVFNKPVQRILDRIIPEGLGRAWHRYLMFALFVVGISSGVRVWELEKYITPARYEGSEIVELTSDRWILEIYRTVIETLQGLAWVLLVFFIVTLLALVIVRVFEGRSRRADHAASAEAKIGSESV
jgi:hypothetical protein